ncbi:MAG TPA: hypothetical protein VK157_07135 [Phycisphaerales bacterium]|nr:hypothetical protein [Phycisphaerales bacterium]
MRRVVQIILIAAGILLVPALIAPFAGLRPPQWKRESPLANPIPVTTVRDGTLTLADGRTLRPAGITRRANITPAQFDEALRIMTAQGFTITRDLGDGTALLHCEPRFYNTCGTSQQGRFFRPGWAGSYLPCPLSELLIIAAYADPTPADSQADQPTSRATSLTPHERWRLQATASQRSELDEPARLIPTQTALRYGTQSLVSEPEYDAIMEAIWQPPPWTLPRDTTPRGADATATYASTSLVQTPMHPTRCHIERMYIRPS